MGATMSEYRNGEVLQFEWEDPPTEWYVAGHLPFDVAIAEVQQHMDCYHLERDREEVQYALGECRYLWAEWVPVDEDDVQEHGFYLEAYSQKADGLFPVTKVYDLEELEYHRRKEQERTECADAIEAKLRKCYPEILTIETGCYTPGEGWAEFTIAGIEGGVRWEEKSPLSMYVYQKDHDTWRKLYQGRRLD